jgi:putative heme-binding domain-containing protein
VRRMIIIGGALAAVALVGAGLSVNALAQAPERQMRDLVVPKSTKNPFTGNAQALEEGRSAFNTTCIACHGINAGAGEFAPGLAIAGRNYAIRTDEQIFGAIKNGIPGTPMPPHAGRLSDDQIWKITAYIYSLRGTAIDAPTAGDVTAGEQIFFGKGQCASCHQVRGKGSILGPDLTNIASQRRTATIVAALTKVDNREYPPGGYQSYQLATIDNWPAVTVTRTSGVAIRGILRNQDSYSVQLLGLDGKLYLLKRSDVKSLVFDGKRLMPSDYDKRLTPKEFADLMAYLTRLGTRAPEQKAAAE